MNKYVTLNDALIYAEIGERLLQHDPYPDKERDLALVFATIRTFVTEVLDANG